MKGRQREAAPEKMGLEEIIEFINRGKDLELK